jgi:hypothetical protein
MTDNEFGFTRTRDDVRALEPYLNPLPRSISGSGRFVLLDGEWRFALDLDDRGLHERWYLGHGYSRGRLTAATRGVPILSPRRAGKTPGVY